MQDRIEKEIELKAPVSRVWRALTDHEEFGEWFRVALDGPFRLGEVSTGKVTYPGCEHMQWHATVVAMEPEELFAYTWLPGALHEAEAGDPPPTRVEFHLRPSEGGGTHLRVVESGFKALPEDRRETAFRENEGGWEQQMANIEAHVDG